MTTAARTLLVLVGALLAVAAVVLLTVAFGQPTRVEAPPLAELAPGARSPADFARLSCVHVQLATQSIQADAAIITVRTELASARALAGEALRHDGRYAPLSGGVASLDEAIRNDDGEAAALAVDVLAEQCEGLIPRSFQERAAKTTTS